MKLTILLLILSLEAFSARLPGHFRNKRRRSRLQEHSQQRQFSKQVDNIFDTQESILIGTDKGHGNKWHLSGMITNLSASRSGIFGVAALKAKSGVELEWERRSSQNNTSGHQNEKLIGGRSLSDLESELKTIEKSAHVSRKISNKRYFSAQLRLAFKKVLGFINPLGHLHLQGWQVKKLRIDLSFSSKGKFLGFANSGAEVRIRTDWKITPASFVERNLDKKNQNFFNLLSNSLGQVFPNHRIFNSYQMSAISIGSGITNKGSWGLGTSNVGYAAKLFFYPSTKQILDIPNRVNLKKISIPVFGKLRGLSKKKLSKGLIKGRDLGRFFVYRAQRKTGRWYIPKLKITLDLDYTGIFGLSRSTGKGLFEFYFKRNKV